MEDKDKAKINDNLQGLVSCTKWNSTLEAKLRENLFKAKKAKLFDKFAV